LQPDGHTPLHLAVIHGQVEAVSLLIFCGGDMLKSDLVSIVYKLVIQLRLNKYNGMAEINGSLATYVVLSIP
jgi:hypothetical protein